MLYYYYGMKRCVCGILFLGERVHVWDYYRMKGCACGIVIG